MCKCINKAIITFALATIILIPFIEEYYKNINFSNRKKPTRILSKIANQQSQNQSSPTSSQENPTISTTIQNPQTSIRFAFHDNPYTFEERHARLSEPLEPVQRQAPLSEPTYNLYPTLPQELKRVRNISQNQNTVKINRQIIHPRRNRIFQTPRVHFDIPQSPTPTTSENPNSTLPETPPLLSQRSTSSIPSNYSSSTPTSEQIRENPFDPPQFNTTTILDNALIYTRRTKLSKRPNRHFYRYINIIIPTRNTVTTVNTIIKSDFTDAFFFKFPK